MPISPTMRRSSPRISAGGASPRASQRVCPTCQGSFDDHEFCPDDGARLFLLGFDDDDRIGEVLDGKLTLTELIGAGALGTVYKAVQHRLGREVAVKLLHRDYAGNPDMARRFLREARLLSRVSHPNIMTIYEFGQTPDRGLYLVMELLRGETLSDLRLRSDLTDEQIVEMAGQICDGLSHAHAAGLVHRDIKPENIFLAVGPVPDQPVVKVLDFGLAKTGGDEVSVTKTGVVCGTPVYVSPEQAQAAPVDRRSDIYSLGIVLYELLCGEVPFEHSVPIKVLMAHLRDEPAPLRGRNPDRPVSAALEAAVLKALRKRPDERYSTVMELKAALEAALKTPDAAPAPDPPRDAKTEPALPAPPRVVEPPRASKLTQLTDPRASSASNATTLLGTVAGPPRRRSGRVAAAGALAVLGLVLVGYLVGSVLSRLHDRAGGQASVRLVDDAPRAPRAASQTSAAEGLPDRTPPTVRVADPTNRRARRGHERTATAPAPRQILVETRPGNARIFLNGEPLGTSPVRMEAPPAGTAVEVSATKRGYAPVRERIDTTHGERLRLELRRRKRPTRRPPSGGPVIVE